jgi:hypothetical protein
MSDKKIRSALKHLIDENVLITGNYNKLAYDRTLWYALTEKGKCICQNGQMEVAKKANGFDEKGEPIPYINTYKETNINTDNISSQNKDFDTPKTSECEEVVKAYNDICRSLPKILKLTDKRKKAIKARLKTYGFEEIKKAFETAENSEFLKGNNDRGWKADFDFIMTESKLIGILEGKYNFNNRQKTSKIEIDQNFRDRFLKDNDPVDWGM